MSCSRKAIHTSSTSIATAGSSRRALHQVGALSGAAHHAVTLLNEGIRWQEPRPLVFLNGCHTTGLEPEQALELVSALVRRAQAAGVVGTEITVFEPLARAFAEDCLRRFLGGTSLGWAIREARLTL